MELKYKGNRPSSASQFYRGHPLVCFFGSLVELFHLREGYPILTLLYYIEMGELIDFSLRFYESWFFKATFSKSASFRESFFEGFDFLCFRPIQVSESS
jgi:hypothetical protein